MPTHNNSIHVQFLSMPRFGAMLSLHGRLAGIALLLLLMWGVYYATTHEKAALLIDSVTIAVEHQKPAAVSVTRSIGSTEHIVDIFNESDEALGVSVPDSWVRDEVRNVALATIIADSPGFGFRRWTLPPNAIVTFMAPREWNELTLHNASDSLLRVRVNTIDPAHNTIDTNSYLLQDDDVTIRFSTVKR